MDSLWVCTGLIGRQRYHFCGDRPSRKRAMEPPDLNQVPVRAAQEAAAARTTRQPPA